MRFDHVVIAVHDLDDAVRDYEALGFTVIYGGEHASGTTHNATITFVDGSYLELMAETGKAPVNDAVDYSYLLKNEEGVVAYALASDDLNAAAEAMRARGLKADDPQPGERLRKDGVKLQWQTMSVEGSMSPFFIQDVTARNQRIPDAAGITTHLNGVTGVAALTFVFDDADAATRRYAAILGQSPMVTDKGIVFHLAGTDLLINPEGEQGLHLETPYRLVLHTTDPERAGIVPMNAARGARLIITQETV